MIALDAVVVYRIFGLSLDALFALFRIPVTVAIILFTLRIPFKRKYHWAFLAWNFAFLWGSSLAFLAQSSTTAASALFWYHPFEFFGTGTVQVTLAFQFAIFFISSNPARWQKLLLGGGYLWAAAVVWIPGVIDPDFITNLPHLTQFGWTTLPGNDAPYLVPDGIDWYYTSMVIIIFYLLVRHYRSEKSPLKKGQTMYIMAGLFFIFVGYYQHIIASYAGLQNVPVLQNLISAPGDLLSLFGLKRKGFYSVAPVAETAKVLAPLRYPLQEARSYRTQDPTTAFEAFSELVRNGHEGLMITRNFPQNVRTDYGIETTPIRWLAESKAQDAIPPSDLLGLSLMVKDFIGKATKPVVMLHGIEYLTTLNGFTPILRLIQGLSEESATKGGIIILPLVPDTLSRQDEALLTTETIPIPIPSAA